MAKQIYQLRDTTILCRGKRMTLIEKTRLSSKEPELIAVLNPEIQDKATELSPLAPRLDTLNGKTVYLVDIGFGGDAGGYSLLTEMQKWFNKHYPQVNTVLKRKTGSFGADAPDVWEEIKAKGSAMIMAIGH